MASSDHAASAPASKRLHKLSGDKSSFSCSFVQSHAWFMNILHSMAALAVSVGATAVDLLQILHAICDQGK